ncbi:MAG: hypothetical protein BGO29_12195 [Bacteroidales bacterium 36-12]|nr:MAG: hypothetical protein BGO29_12195 [Bacteroidales bacterium 36-12]
MNSSFTKEYLLIKRNIFFVALLLLLVSNSLFAQTTQNRLYNPVFNMRDGAVEKFMGHYYVFGTSTAGKMSYSKNLINWSGPVTAITTNEATWLNNPKWTQASTYKEMGAGDMIYRNGVFHTYWNGIGHGYSATPTGPYKEGAITEPFDDYGIDVQVFQDEDGEIYWVKKRNPSDPNPMTGVPSNIDGPEVWIFKMNSPFSRWDITKGSVQLTHQRGHPTSVNHINFEGPELAKYRDKYYLFYASNRMGPRSGMYEVGVAESDKPDNYNNTKKYPHPVLTRNTEQHLIDYNVILYSAEHGGWVSRYSTRTPTNDDWKAVDFNDDAWTAAQGGFGRQEYDLFAGTTFTNAKIRARKTVWNTPKIYIRRKFSLTELPSKIALKHWIFGDADFYINGTKISVNTRNNTYGFLQLNPELFVVGDNIIAVEVASPCSDQNCQQFIDFGLYDTGDTDAEDIVVGQSQPNFIAGPNGFERWMMYKAFYNATEQQGVDRVHFYDREVVVESSTVKNTKGYRPKPSLPSMINYCDYPIYSPFNFLNNSTWKISGGVLYPEKETGGELLLVKDAETNYRFEVPFRIKQTDATAGVYAFYQDQNNWLKIGINKNGTWKKELCVNGITDINEQNIPEKFAFLDANPLVANYEEPWHTLVVYKNGGKFNLELDYFKLTLNSEIDTPFEGAGLVGLTASSGNVSFDAIQYTMGWDEYDSNISNWEYSSGTWQVNVNGLIQSDVNGKALAIKGDPSWNYEFSVYAKNKQLPASGKAGFYPLYIDENNYISASIDYSNKTLNIVGKDNGVEIESISKPLKKKVQRYYTYTSYPTESYRYDLRNESVISGVDILWFEGNYPYLNQTFDLPQTVKFYALQNGIWTLLSSELEGELRFSEMNHFTFPAVKTTAIRMDVTNKIGRASRTFSAYFDEEVSAGYYLRCRREEDGLHIFVDDQYYAAIQGNWEKSRIGLSSENMPVTFNGILHYQTGSIATKSISINPANCDIGESVQLTTQILPVNATNQNVKWESSNPSIISVSESGIMTRHAAGTVRITANSCDGGLVKGTMDVFGTGVKTEFISERIKIYPNPVRDKLVISNIEGYKSLKIFKLDGNQVFNEETPLSEIVLDMTSLEQGFYLLQLQNDYGEFTTTKILKI